MALATRHQAALLLALVAFSLGCNPLLDIDHIQFGATSGQGASGGSPSTGGMAGGEDCTNGADDDADGAIDCSDSDCTEFGCVAPPPEGWEGPIAFWLGAPADAPSCAAGWATEQRLHDALVAPDATCEPCNCSAPAGGTCGFPDTLVYNTTDCSGAIQATLTPTMMNDCDSFALLGLMGSAHGEGVPVLDEGDCMASGGAPTVTAATWTDEALLCSGAAGAGCTEGLCVPAATAPISLCIYQAGDVACPNGYTGRSVVHEDFTDDRSCTPCDCSNGQNGSCSGTTTIHLGTQCGGVAEIVQNDGTGCNSFTVSQINNSYSYQGDAEPSGGDCPTVGGQPTGSAAPTGTITVCCAS